MTNKNYTILYVCIDSSLGGSTSSLYNLIESVQDTVYPIVLFPEKGEGASFFQEHGIECYFYPFIKLYKFKKNHLYEVITHPWRWHYIKKLRSDWKCISYMKSVLKGRKVDIVHTNTSPNDIGVSLAKALRAKHVWHVREYLDCHYNFDIYRGIPRLQRLINQADARIAVSSAIEEHWRMQMDNTWVINNAIRASSDACYFSHKDPYVLFVSYNLTENKGTRSAIVAFAKSGITKQSFRLKLIGNCQDSYKLSLIQTAIDLKVQDFIDFIPCQRDVKPYFAHASAFLMTSEFEGLGRVSAEAMFFGCLVIAHASGGTLDLIKDGDTGYLYTTIDECASKLRKVCTSDNKTILIRAQQYAIDNFSKEAYRTKVLEVYKKVMLSHGED